MLVKMKDNVNVLVLLTDLVGAIGGIQSYNRSLVKALSRIAEEHNWNLTILVLNDCVTNLKTTTDLFAEIE